MSITPPKPDYRHPYVSVAYDAEADLVYLTPPNGAYARVGTSQLKRTVKIDGCDLDRYFVRVNKLARPDRQRTFVWLNGTKRKIELPLSVANHDLLMQAINEVLVQRKTQEVVDAVHDYLKAPPP